MLRSCSLFDLVHELSLVAQSIESTLSELIEMLTILWEQLNAFYIGRGQDYYSYGA